ncbi:hypothetical protein CK203_007472 [Vitis vinifera]|uniref:Uncharacterized protein n=1 Tax=Vitis vinifera TaxID=29760 RepID=A0A438G1A1_VITVI|nr:hypothetical protein CK203_007472 [Vitis vinifera]
MDGHVILNTQGVLDSVVAPAKGIRTGCPDAPSDGFVSHGISRSISSYEWLSETMVGDAAVRDRGKRLCRMIVGSDLLSLPLVFSFCRRFISGWLMLTIRMCCGDYPDVYALPASFALPWIGEDETSFCFGFVVRNGSKKDCFVCPDLVNEEAAMPTEKGGKNAILFTKEQFNAGSGSLCRRCSRNSSTSLKFPLSLFTQPCPGADGMQHHQHACVRSPALPSNGDRTARFDKGRGEGAGGSLGWMGGAIAASVEAFFSELYLKIPDFALLIFPDLSGRNSHLLLLTMQIPRRGLQNIALGAEFDRGRPGAQEYVINILPRKLAKDEIVPGEHYTVKSSPSIRKLKKLTLKGGESSWRIEIRKRLKALSGRLPDRSGVRTPSEETQEKGEAGEEAWEGCEETHSSQGRPRAHVGVESLRSSLVAAARLANVAEEAASINHPGNLNPDAAETAPLEEAGAESQSQPSDDPDRLAIVLVKGPPSRSRV